RSVNSIAAWIAEDPLALRCDLGPDLRRDDDWLGSSSVCPRESAVHRVARRRVARLRLWIHGEIGASGFSRSPAPSCGRGTPPVGLLGLGPGLTPSGDDVLCGVLVALHALGEPRAAGKLGDAIAAETRRATTPLSGAFLAAAAQGMGSE